MALKACYPISILFIWELTIILHFFFSQARCFDCVTNLTQWLSQMLILYNSNQENRRMIQELITHIIDTCAPLVDVNVCTKRNSIPSISSFSQNSDKPIALSAGSLLYSIIPLTRQHLAIDQMNSIKPLIHRILTWNVTTDSKTNFEVNLFLRIKLHHIVSSCRFTN